MVADLDPPRDATWLGVDGSAWPRDDDPHPFIRYRTLLGSYRRARSRGWGDERFIELVRRLDDAVQEVDGRGFEITPTRDDRVLAGMVGHAGPLWVKDETHNVGGSHKARHLFGLALHLEIDGLGASSPLAISSCGNAALAASIIARAAGRPLRVFVPTWADASILDRLDRNGARIEVCERSDGKLGDPCYVAFVAAVHEGAVSFGCQGPDEPRTLDGARTLGWEIADQVENAERLVVHVGGGALGSSLVQGLAGAVALERWTAMPRVDTVQTEGCAPLAAAFERLRTTLGDAPVERWIDIDPQPLMQPWPSEPASMADGILDDVTYDWVVLAWAMLATGGDALVAREPDVGRAHRVATDAGWHASATGSAGIAGLITRPDPAASTVVVMSGAATD